MADVLLVHGSCHGAWCWRDLAPALLRYGHEVRAIDLPGHGKDNTPTHDVTLDSYACAIADACARNTVLVGHSMGGYAITAAAERVPEKISRLIYLCAYVPVAGKTLAEMRKMAPRQPILQAIDISRDRKSFTMIPEKAREIFYHDCTSADADWAISNLCAQAIAPAETVIDLTNASSALPRRFIRCLDDRTIPPEFQITMTKNWPDAHVQDMHCGHSPFLAAPEALAHRIDKAIRT